MAVHLPTRSLGDDEQVLLRFRPHWKVLLPGVIWGMLLAALAGMALAALPASWRWWSVAVALALWLLLATRSAVSWWSTTYVLTTERIVVRRGLVARTGTEIPLESITNVLFRQRTLQRLLGYGDVLVESAGSQGQSRLDDIPHPDAFQSQIYRAREARSIQLRGPAGPGGQGGQVGDVLAQLEVLASLRERGHLTEEEFAAQKRRVLSDRPSVDLTEAPEPHDTDRGQTGE